ncbi:DNA-binding protein [Pseudoroseomonas deserti]|uniref:DNA-binding protein n=1 Tax=Teichococcus deserti TaxID=1817963 RepID=A0A1V2H438_9PROT|nr:hemolysin family protein [Pseudoroseomonas deserti]ONG55784.1 DNA-binding protein [Pseudoroseomonas deserti]
MLEIVIVVALILLNGIFALSELSVVSSRPRRLQILAEEGRPGAKAALALLEEPGRFLSTVQIGITLVGILAGAFSGEALGGRLTAWLQEQGMSPGLAGPLGFGLVIVIITYLSIVIGELVPKRFALRSPETLACLVAPGMRLLARIGTPVAWLLDASVKLVFRLLGVGPEQAAVVTDEEIRSVVAEAEGSGTIEAAERHLIAGVMRLGDRPVRGVMTPRTEVDWLDLAAGEERIRETLMTTQHSRLPVGEGSTDAMLGVVQTRQLLAQVLAGHKLDVRQHVQPAPVIPDTADALDALSVLREAAVPMALVHDEYGHFEGVVTPADLLETIAGAFRADADTDEPAAVQREDGSWLLAGWLAADEMAEHLSIRLPLERDYQTLAGYLLQAFGRLPRTGEHIERDEWRFEVVDLDGHRIDKVLAQPAQASIGLHRVARGS